MERKPLQHNNEMQSKVKEKFHKILDRGCIEIVNIEFVELLMYMFHIPKGTNICMVYNGTNP